MTTVRADRDRMRAARLLTIGVMLVTSASGSAAASASDCGLEAGTGCAPDSARVDLATPAFSKPTAVTNPLFPISNLHSAVLLGNVDGHQLRVETTLLPGTEAVDVNGQQVDALISQYVAYLDGRIEEVAVDRYAQADDGSVWYLGEDVFNYADGVVADTEGTWLAGKDGPAAMIMPAAPQVGDVFRPENSPGIVFEEVTVTSAGASVDGPSGPVDGALIADELHIDGSHEDKTFAPGYGEFASGAHGNVEALALTVPTDARSGPPPAELVRLSTGAAEIFDAAGSGDWDAASATLDELTAAGDSERAGGVPPLLAAQVDRALAALRGDALTPAVEGQNPAGARKAAIDLAMAALDLQLPYRPPTEIDVARFDLWARQLAVDTTAGDPAAIAGDVSVLERIRDRIAHTLDEAAAKDIDAHLTILRAAADAQNLAAVATTAPALLDTLAAIQAA